MKLLVLSDLHLEFGQFRVPEVAFDVVILAGDVAARANKVPFWACRARNFGEATPIVFVLGNHEFYGAVMSSTLRELRQASMGTNFHTLDCQQIVIDGVRFLGCRLWTDFALHINTLDGPRSDAQHAAQEAGRALADFQVIGVEDNSLSKTANGQPQRSRRLFSPKDAMALHREHRAWLSRKLKDPFEGQTVVTHHAPNRGSLAARYATDWVSGAFVNELPHEFFKVPALWIHGHTHESFDYQVGECRVVCNPRGYLHGGHQTGPENERFDPSFVIDLNPK